MKKILFFLFFIAVIMNSLLSQEIQLSFGTDFAFGVSNDNSKIAWTSGSDAYFINQDIDTLYFAPGLSSSMRVFYDTNKTSRGFFFRDRALIVTNYKQAGNASLNDYTVKISETHSIAEKNEVIAILDFDFGPSIRWIISKRLQFYTDGGINLTIMGYEEYDTDNTSNYWGAGIYAACALQMNLTERMYLEFGLNSVINVFSSTEGTLYTEDFGYKKVKYKDSGRWDLTSSAVYINIGWRIFKKQQTNY